MSSEFTDTIPGTTVARGLNKDDLIVLAGAGGFIAGSLTRYFHDQGYTRIRAIDRKPLPEWYQRVPGVECLSMDLSQERTRSGPSKGATEVYNLAADMGGMGFIERFRVECLRSILINTHMIEAAYRAGVQRYFFSSSACAYNTDLQKTPEVVALKESDAYPAMAERGYGWEKLISEMFCQEYWAERGLETHIARFHNIYGPHGTWYGGREKAPAAISRKVIEAKDTGDMRSNLGRRHPDPQLLLHRRLPERHRPDHALRRADRHADQPRLERAGLDQRAGDASSRRSPASSSSAATSSTPPRASRAATATTPSSSSVLGWEPNTPLRDGMAKTYAWIADQYAARKAGRRVVVECMTIGPDAGPLPATPGPRALREVIGSLPFRLQMAGGWIDQPFLSKHNPEPPGSMVVVPCSQRSRSWPGPAWPLGPARRHGRCGATPCLPPVAGDLVRELYAAENADLVEPSGSQDMCGLIYPGISRLDYDASVEGGWFPAHIGNPPPILAWWRGWNGSSTSSRSGSGLLDTARWA